MLPQLIFSRITKEDGLASNNVFQISRDSTGYLWLATRNGLQRYDANRFLTFRHIPGDSTSIPQNNVSHLFIDSKSRMWISFDHEIGIFSTANFKYRSARLELSVNMIRKIMEDDKGRILIFADNKILVYDEKQNSFAANFSLPAVPPGYTISDMAIDTTGDSYWFTGKQGSLIYNSGTEQFSPPLQNNTNGASIDSLLLIKNARYPLIAKDENWWIVSWIPFTGTPPSLYNYDRKKNRFHRFEKLKEYKPGSYYEIWNIFQQSNGTIWAYGMGLLAYYNQKENKFIHVSSDAFRKNGIEYDYVNSLYEDKEKNVWVSTNKGLYRFNTEAQVFQNHLNRFPGDTVAKSNNVTHIIQTNNNEIWVSTWGSGIYSYTSDLDPVPNPVTNADPLNALLHAGSMIQRSNGEIWIGTHTGELKIYEPSTGKNITVVHSSFKGKNILQLLEDNTGTVWIGTTNDFLVKCINGNWKDSTVSFQTIMKDAGDILKLYSDNRNHLWICTSTNGLIQMDMKDGKIIKHYKENPDKNEGLLSSGAADIVQWNDSIYLIASDGLCILNIRTQKFRYLVASDGLPAEHITNLIVDKQKRLWVACEGGLYRLNIDNKLYVTYDAADGITSDIFQVGSGTLLRDGRIAIGTPGDFLLFDPEKTGVTKQVPAIEISGFTVGTEKLLVDSLLKLDKLILDYDNTFLHVELSSLTFRDRFYIYYMLEGLDKDWKRAWNNEIIYQYLPPGDYTLKLKTRNGDGEESKKITTLQIEVDAPFWKTWWFYSLLVLLLGGFLFWLDNERIKRKTAVLKMRSDIADELHQDINKALSNITILSEMANRKADREPEKSKDLIEQIRRKSQDMTVAMDDILWSIDPDNDSMKNFMLRFREYVDAIKSQYNADIDVLIDKKAEQLQLKMKNRNDIYWLFKGGITNTVRTGARNCRIHITYIKQELVYTLEFDTSQINMEALTNLRLRNELSEKLKELDARLVFSQHVSTAVFVLSIPVKGDGF